MTRVVVLFFIDLSTRGVEIGGIASSANTLWMAQIARNLTDTVDGFFNTKRYLIHDQIRSIRRSFSVSFPGAASKGSNSIMVEHDEDEQNLEPDGVYREEVD